MAFKKTSSSDAPEGFSRDFGGREAPCIGVFGEEGTGKTRLLATAEEWAQEQGTTPGWIVLDRKTRRTVREVYAALGYDLPFIQKEDFISQAEALEIAALDRESDKDNAKIQKIYTEVFRKVIAAAGALGSHPKINPVIIETGTGLWDWISFAHFGRKQGVGKGRMWGPPKQDWTDLLDSLSHKTVIISFWEKDAYKGDDKAGYTKPDGPPHVGYTTTSLVRLTHDKKRKLKDDESYVDRFGLDIFESQDNKGLEGVNGLLTGDSITYTNLINMLRPE